MTHYWPKKDLLLHFGATWFSSSIEILMIGPSLLTVAQLACIFWASLVLNKIYQEPWVAHRCSDNRGPIVTLKRWCWSMVETTQLCIIATFMYINTVINSIKHKCTFNNYIAERLITICSFENLQQCYCLVLYWYNWFNKHY